MRNYVIGILLAQIPYNKFCLNITKDVKIKSDSSTLDHLQQRIGFLMTKFQGLKTYLNYC